MKMHKVIKKMITIRNINHSLMDCLYLCLFALKGVIAILFVMHVSIGVVFAGDHVINHYFSSGPTVKTITQSERNLPIVAHADVIVVGGGISGVVAALKAAEKGMTVIILESRNYFGQEITATNKCTDLSSVIEKEMSFSSEFFNELAQRKIVTNGMADPIALRSFLLEKVLGNSKIEVFLYSLANGVVHKNGKITGVVFSGRDGRQVILSKAVIDATEDGRIAAALGAKVDHDNFKENIARRYIAIERPEYLPVGPLGVSSKLSIVGDYIMIHDKYIELAISAEIGNDIAGDYSSIQAKTLEKSFLLRDFLITEGIDLKEFTPGSETWFDKTALVACKEKWNTEMTKSIKQNEEFVTPLGTEGLLVTGRIVMAQHQVESISDLIILGELAGTSVEKIVQESDVINFPVQKSLVNSDEKGKLQINELLDGIEKGMTYPQLTQSSVEIPVRGEYDVLVVGGGTSGALAAISAARQGVRVALIEILPNLGGISTNRVNAYYWGVPWKSFLRQEIGERIKLSKSVGDGPLEKVRFSGEDKKYVLQDLAIKAGVKIYYQSLATGALIENDKIKGVVVDNSSGRHILKAHIVIDATGNAGVAIAGGAKYAKGRETDGFMNEIEHGPMRDPTNLKDISISYLKYPSYSVSLNIRESRRIIGDYTVTFDDVIQERTFSDVVCRWRSNYDTHLPTSANQSDLAQDWVGILGLWRKPIIGSIPYQSLLPKGIENILVAAMAYSTDHDALIGGRMQADMEHLGEAAGVVAAFACKLNVAPRMVPVKTIQGELVKLGVLRNNDVPDLGLNDAPTMNELQVQDLWRNERDKEFPPSEEGKRLSVETAIPLLGTENSLKAMVDLYLIGGRSIPALKPLLKSQNRTIYEEAAVLLGLLGDREAIPALLEFLKERNTRRFEFALPQASSRPSVPLYWTSIILLGRFAEKSAVKELITILNYNPKPENLVDMRRSQYGDDMFININSCPPSLASFTIVALGRIGDTKAIEAIKPYLNVSGQTEIARENRDSEIVWGISTNASWALAKLGDQSGVPVLIELLESEQYLVRNYSRELLENITGKNLGNEYQEWAKWWQKSK